jgi:hypothetical protein
MKVRKHMAEQLFDSKGRVMPSYEAVINEAHARQKTQSEADIINADRKYMAQLQRAYLEKIGVQVRVEHFTGGTTSPKLTEYRLRYSFVEAVAFTLDIAIAAFVEKLLQHVPIEKAGE